MSAALCGRCGHSGADHHWDSSGDSGCGYQANRASRLLSGSCNCSGFRTVEQEEARRELVIAIQISERWRRPDERVIRMDLNIVRGYAKRLLDAYQ
jgi:hypothetical protein